MIYKFYGAHIFGKIQDQKINIVKLPLSFLVRVMKPWKIERLA